jgi:hypothetical protein
MKTPSRDLLLIYGKNHEEKDGVYRILFIGIEGRSIPLPTESFKNVQELGSFALDICRREGLGGVRAVSVDEWNEGVRGVESVFQIADVLGVIGGRLANPYVEESGGNFFQRMLRS